MTDYTPPTQEEIERVAAYWRRVELLACTHKSGFNFSSDASGHPICADCDQRLHFLTDIQIEERKRQRPMDEDVLGTLLARLRQDRGGVTVEVDGQWHDLRFEAHGYDGTNPDSEYAVASIEQVIKMLRATGVR